MTLQETVPRLGETGYESDYSRAFTSQAQGCAFMIGCSIEKKARQLFFYDYTVTVVVNDNRRPR